MRYAAPWRRNAPVAGVLRAVNIGGYSTKSLYNYTLPRSTKAHPDFERRVSKLIKYTRNWSRYLRDRPMTPAKSGRVRRIWLIVRGSHSFKGATRSERVAGPVTVIDRNEQTVETAAGLVDAADIPLVDRVVMAVLVGAMRDFR